MRGPTSSSSVKEWVGSTREGTRVFASSGGAETFRGVETFRGTELAAALLRRVFQHLPFGFSVRLWTGQAFAVGAPQGAVIDDRFTLRFLTPQAVCNLVLGRDPLRLAEAYFRSDVDIEGDLFAALRLKDHLEQLQLPMRERLGAWSMAHKLRSLNKGPWLGTRDARPQAALRRDLGAAPSRARAVNRHSKHENREAIHFHYDVSNEFYRLWLGRSMVYSCAYFEEPHYSLDDAQQAKLDYICRKLLLRPREQFLDIGCGWGALVIHAARHYGVKAHGITLSEKQFPFAQRRIQEEGLEEQVTVELRDYRDLRGNEVYDKVASIGMFEHVGLENLPLYFDTVHRLLKPSGLFLNHGITHAQAGWHKDVSTEFINRYVFPDGQLDEISNIQRCMEDAQFEIADVEALRAHYARTLRAWVRQLEGRRERALEYVSESTYRVWRLYMAACALEFECGHIGIYQVLANKRGPLLAELPLTRKHLYCAPDGDRLPQRPTAAKSDRARH
jgi:cyclopropane-fatty-acyl-phospholipid synthase